MSLTKIDFTIALQSEKLFQLKNSIGEANIFKSVCALLKMFSDAAKVNKPLSSAEIIMCADFIVKKYTHESIADFALALKDGIFGGQKFYGSVTIADVKETVEKYFEMKAEKLRELHENTKNSNINMGDTIISQLVQSYSNDYSETFKERFDREKREIAQRNIDSWREKMKTLGGNPLGGIPLGDTPLGGIPQDFTNRFETINQPLENDDYNQETTPMLEG